MCGIYPQDFAQRLRSAIDHSNLTQKDLAEKIGVSKTSINNYANGRIPDVHILYKISSFLNVTMEWLLTGEEKETKKFKTPEWLKDLTEKDEEDLEIFLEFLSLRRVKQQNNSHYPITPPCLDDPPIAATKEEKSLYLPILGDAAAGIPIEIIELPQGQVLVNQKHGKYNSFIVRARGNSMIEAGISNGDLVIVRPQPTVENGEIALVNIDGEATIKHFYIDNQTQCELRSANPAYPSIFYHLNDISILGKIIEVIKQE